MLRSTYNKTPLRIMQTWSCRLTREIRTGEKTYPEGTPVTIYGKRGGLHVKGPACEHCGVAVHIVKLAPGDVEVIGREDL